MLLGNYSNLNSNPGKNIGGFTNPYEYRKVSSAMSFYTGWHTVEEVTDKANLYTGTRAPYVLVLSPKAGELVATSTVRGLAIIGVANLAGGLNAEANLAGVGTINSASASLIGFATSALSGIGGLTADITGKIEMAANLAGQGNITAALGALSGAICSIIGTGSLTGDITGKLEASANLAGLGSLTSSIIGLVQLQAALTGSSAIISNIKGVGIIDSSISGLGTLSSSVQALANLSSQLSGLGTLVITSGTIPGSMSAEISSIGGILTAEDVAAAVWNSVAAGFNSVGSMGEKLNDAGGAANPWNEVLAPGLTAAQIMLMLEAFMHGEDYIVDNPDGTKTYYSLACNIIK